MDKMECNHIWNKGLDPTQKNKPFKSCLKCNHFEYITLQEYANFEDMLLEEKIRKIVKEVLENVNKESGKSGS